MPPVPQLPPELWQAIIDRSDATTAAKLQLAVLPRSHLQHLDRQRRRTFTETHDPFADSLKTLNRAGNLRNREAAARRIVRLLRTGARPLPKFVDEFATLAFQKIPKEQYEVTLGALRAKQRPSEYATNVRNINNLKYLHSLGLPIGGDMFRKNAEMYTYEYNPNNNSNNNNRTFMSEVDKLKHLKTLEYRLQHGNVSHRQASMVIQKLLQKSRWYAMDRRTILLCVEKGGRDDYLIYELTSRGELELMRDVLDTGYKVDVQDADLLFAAFYNNNNDMVRLLVDHGVRSQGSLVDAVLSNNAWGVDYLLRHGWNANEVGTRYGSSLTPIMAFTMKPRNPAILAKLLSAGAKPDVVLKHGRLTPLIDAVKKGRLDLVKIFVRHRANYNFTTNGGLTPLGMAIVMRHWDIAKFLIEKGASVHLGSEKDERTPLHLLASLPLNTNQTGYLNVAKMLLNRGADPDARDSRRRTPSSLAYKRGTLGSRKLYQLFDRASQVWEVPLGKRRRVP